jgi:hypothetical protein
VKCFAVSALGDQLQVISKQASVEVHREQSNKPIVLAQNLRFFPIRA